MNEMAKLNEFSYFSRLFNTLILQRDKKYQNTNSNNFKSFYFQNFFKIIKTNENQTKQYQKLKQTISPSQGLFILMHGASRSAAM